VDNRCLPEPPFITFLSDYGLADEFVGVCHGVMLRRCPQAVVIDITHEIPPQDVRTGALVLRDALAYMPAGVHLAVVDPTVGGGGAGARRAVAMRTGAGERLLVGPDNGLLSLAAAGAGGVREAVDISRSAERLRPLSSTFHGRDVFSPVAGALAAGVPLDGIGEPIALESLSGLALPVAEAGDGVLAAHVLRVDRFGNLLLDASTNDLDRAGLHPGREISVEAAGEFHRALRCVAFADVPAGELLLYEDSVRMAALAVNCGSAAELLRAQGGETVLLRAA
jgi:S-adenosyl-L-methionine hydrolase (adenosine-forming)